MDGLESKWMPLLCTPGLANTVTHLAQYRERADAGLRRTSDHPCYRERGCFRGWKRPFSKRELEKTAR